MRPPRPNASQKALPRARVPRPRPQRAIHHTPWSRRALPTPTWRCCNTHIMLATALPQPIPIHSGFPCQHRRACTRPACFHLPGPHLQVPCSRRAHRARRCPRRRRRREWLPITPTPLHPRTHSHRRARALPCKRRHHLSRHITNTTRLLTDILHIGRHTIPGLVTRPRRRLVLLHHLSAPAR